VASASAWLGIRISDATAAKDVPQLTATKRKMGVLSVIVLNV